MHDEADNGRYRANVIVIYIYILHTVETHKSRNLSLYAFFHWTTAPLSIAKTV